MIWQLLLQALALCVATLSLWVASQPNAYKDLSFRDSFWFLLHVDHRGLAVLAAFILADMNFFISRLDLPVWRFLLPALAFGVATLSLRAASQPKAYKDLSVRECLGFLLHVDHRGLAALAAFIIADMNFFISGLDHTIWPLLFPALALAVATLSLLAASQPNAYRDLSLRECLWFLLHVDRRGLAALAAFALADMNYFISLMSHS